MGTKNCEEISAGNAGYLIVRCADSGGQSTRDKNLRARSKKFCSSFEVAPPVPFGGPTLILTARQDQIVGYRDIWDLLDTYPRATFAVLDRAGHFVPIEQDGLCHALMHEWLDRVEECIGV